MNTMPMKRNLLVAAAALSLAATVAPAPAVAQWTVFDPSNYTQNVLTAARTLQQINNQIQSLQNEAQMLLNQAKNLTSLGTSPLAQLRADLQRTQQLIAQAQGLATQVGQLDQQFRQQYPSSYGGGASADRIVADARAQWNNSLEAMRTTLQLQGQVNASIAADEQTLASVVGSSQSAVGLLQAVQATNQLLALQAKQAMQSQQLRIAQDRATALEQSRMLQAEEQGRATRQRFRGQGVTYKPAPVQVYPQ
jgi:P-type conjugative transfer protein TrbJ